MGFIPLIKGGQGGFFSGDPYRGKISFTFRYNYAREPLAMTDTGTWQALKEVAALFLRLGFTAFGGPAAHIAMFHHEVVVRRKWIDEQRFLDLLGATHLIPGPNSTEMAIHIGFVRAGWRGLILAGLCFIAPAMLIVIGLAWAYQQYGTTPAANSVLYGIKPVMIAIIFKALCDLAHRAIKGKLTGIVVAATLALALIGINEIALLLVGGLLVMVWVNFRRIRSDTSALPALLAPLALTGLPFLAAQSFNLPIMFLTFLKIGSVLYGSGYVLLAFLRADFVTRLGWLTDRQLLDAIAIGQVTPGPVFTTATFIGYVLAGIPGALLATLGIFLPAFMLVAITSPYIPRLRSSPWFGALLDGVNAASLGLMAAVTLQLGVASLIDLPAILVSVVSLFFILRTRINPTWLILGGAIVGLARLFLLTQHLAGLLAAGEVGLHAVSQ